MRLIAMFVAAMLVAPYSTGQTPATGSAPQVKPCRQHPDVKLPCFTVHGRLSAWNGTPTLRIWIVGTNRMLGISEGRFARRDYLRLPVDLEAKVSFDSDVFGDFVVCPFEVEKPGAMRPVCVDSATKVVVRARNPQSAGDR